MHLGYRLRLMGKTYAFHSLNSQITSLNQETIGRRLATI